MRSQTPLLPAVGARTLTLLLGERDPHASRTRSRPGQAPHRSRDASLIAGGESVFLDSGTTCLEVARPLRRRPATMMPLSLQAIHGLGEGSSRATTRRLLLWNLTGRAASVATGIALGLICVTWLQARASRRYLIFLCCTPRRLPWRLGAFLHWAYEAGLLRISGMAYQYRHRELQDWLTTHRHL
ncbi:hypothetical protein [Streptomyces chartreusis]|uniref:hypothetical protein n=1 Tax=Streptomyces chartreusis TaxID=1969 RepID=UPI003F4D8187